MMADAAVLHRGFSWQTLPGPWLVMTGVSVAVAMLCLALQGGDDRLINGVSVWHKPFKFALSFIFYFGTIALIARLLPQDFFRRVPGYTMLWAPVLCAVFELAYIGWQAGHGEPSHFNLSTPFSALMYSLMGVGAAVLVFVLLGLAAAVARHNSLRDPVVLAVVLGLCLSCVLGGAFGGYLSAQSGHWVNAAPTDAGGLVAVPLGARWRRSPRCPLLRAARHAGAAAVCAAGASLAVGRHPGRRWDARLCGLHDPDVFPGLEGRSFSLTCPRGRAALMIGRWNQPDRSDL